MALFLFKGAYTSPTCTVRVTSRDVRPIEINRFVVAFEQSLSIEGFLYRDPGATNGVANLTAKMIALEQAMARPNEEVGVATASGPSGHWLRTTGTIGGIVIKDFKFSDTPLQFATEIKYSFTASAIYGNSADLFRNIVSLEETVSVTGDGTADIMLAPQAGARSVYQQVADFTDVQVVQSGRVTSKTLASIPAPLIAIPGARVGKLSRDSISYQMVGTSVLLHIREYQYTFNLNDYPGTIVPNILT